MRVKSKLKEKLPKPLNYIGHMTKYYAVRSQDDRAKYHNSPRSIRNVMWLFRRDKTYEKWIRYSKDHLDYKNEVFKGAIAKKILNYVTYGLLKRSLYYRAYKEEKYYKNFFPPIFKSLMPGSPLETKDWLDGQIVLMNDIAELIEAHATIRWLETITEENLLRYNRLQLLIPDVGSTESMTTLKMLFLTAEKFKISPRWPGPINFPIYQFPNQPFLDLIFGEEELRRLRIRPNNN